MSGGVVGLVLDLDFVGLYRMETIIRLVLSALSCKRCAYISRDCISYCRTSGQYIFGR